MIFLGTEVFVLVSPDWSISARSRLSPYLCVCSRVWCYLIFVLFSCGRKSSSRAFQSSSISRNSVSWPSASTRTKCFRFKFQPRKDRLKFLGQVATRIEGISISYKFRMCCEWLWNSNQAGWFGSHSIFSHNMLSRIKLLYFFDERTKARPSALITMPLA